MSIVTVSRQMGSLGYEVAAKAALRLGYRLVWRDVINEAARRAGAPEAALAELDELGLIKLCPSPKVCHAYQRAIAKVMHELAGEGSVVIVGRAGQVILREHPEVLHVQIVAPLHLRAARVAADRGIEREAAESQVIASDDFRRRYLKRFYHARWDDPSLYDLVLNTERFSVDQAADLIMRALTARKREQPGITEDTQAKEPSIESV